MASRRHLRFINAQMGWMLGTIVVLGALGSLSLDLFFLVSLVGLLLVIELTAPVAVTPQWRRRLRWVIVAGLVGFGYIVIRRLIEILPEGLF